MSESRRPFVQPFAVTLLQWGKAHGPLFKIQFFSLQLCLTQYLFRRVMCTDAVDAQGSRLFVVFFSNRPVICAIRLVLKRVQASILVE